MNPYIDEKMYQERRREMLAEARHRQLIAAYRAANPPTLVRLQLALGKTLIRWGILLTRRYTEQFDLSPEVSQQHP